MSDLAWYRERRTQRRIKWLGLLAVTLIATPLAIGIGHQVRDWTGLPAFSYCVQLAVAFSVGWRTSGFTHRYCQKRWEVWMERHLGVKEEDRA